MMHAIVFLFWIFIGTPYSIPSSISSKRSITLCACHWNFVFLLNLTHRMYIAITTFINGVPARANYSYPVNLSRVLSVVTFKFQTRRLVFPTFLSKSPSPFGPRTRKPYHMNHVRDLPLAGVVKGALWHSCTRKGIVIDVGVYFP